MGLLDWVKGKSGKVSLPIRKEVARELGGFDYKSTWTCYKCLSNLRIRARVDRADGPSNFVALPNGHSKLPAHELNWNGLAEERGWLTDPPTCPKCK